MVFLSQVRDWNEELQGCRELPRGTIQERLHRERTIFKVREPCRHDYVYVVNEKLKSFSQNIRSLLADQQWLCGGCHARSHSRHWWECHTFKSRGAASHADVHLEQSLSKPGLRRCWALPTTRGRQCRACRSCVWSERSAGVDRNKLKIEEKKKNSFCFTTTATF